MWNEPVYNRTQTDVDRVNYLKSIAFSDMTAAEKTEWLSGLKGSLNKADLDRINNNINILLDTFEVEHDTVVTPEFPTTEYFTTLLSYLQTLYDFDLRFSYTPSVPTAPINNFQKVNDIEKILNDIYRILNNNFSYYCGEGYFAGDSIGLLL